MVKIHTKKTRKLYLGWLHRSRGQSRYKQVRMKDGGGVRELTYSEDEDITIDYLKAKATQLFFPLGVSKFGDSSEMNLEMGNFAQNKITSFKDTTGKECMFPEYLKSHGLYASKSHMYLMSSIATEEEESLEGKDSEDSPPMLRTSPTDKKMSPEEEYNLEGKDSGDPPPMLSGISPTDEDMSAEGSTFTGSIKSRMASTPIREESSNEVRQKRQVPLFGVALKEDAATLCTTETTGAHHLLINYEMHTESSYSEVTLTSVAFSRRDCYDLKCAVEPEIQDEGIEEFDPLEHGFTVTHISKGDNCFVDRQVESSDVLGNESPPIAVFPKANLQAEAAKLERLILHPPSEVWGYDGSELIIGVVAKCHSASNAFYVWYRNGAIYKQGCKVCCIAVNDPGLYTVEVQCGEERDVSEELFIRNLNSQGSFARGKEVLESDNKNRAESSKSTCEESGSFLPLIEKEELSFSTADVIGRGSLGAVYKGEWAGTAVAVKAIKIRNASRIKPVLESEVRVHSMVWHPNIVQIMAVSVLKNSVLLVSELIDGLNLEEMLFGDSEDNETLTIQTCDKMHIGKQICQAVAYLNNLKPPIVHRDIKPANIMVARATHTTKLCDMGIGKLKSVQSRTHTTSQSVPGTPSYMAPECLVEKKKATTQSDVWSLGCTLLELFTEKDSWEDLPNKSGDGTAPLIEGMKAEVLPASLELLSSTVGAPLEHILKGCFQYCSDKRPRAINLVHVFP